MKIIIILLGECLMDEILYSYASGLKREVDELFNCSFVHDDAETYNSIYNYIERIKEHAVRNSKT